MANLVTRLDREERRKSYSNGGELSADDQAYFGIQTGPPLTGARRSNQPDPFQRAVNRQSPYPRGSTRGRSNGRHVRFAASNGRSRTSTRCSHCNIVGHDEKDCRNKNSDSLYILQHHRTLQERMLQRIQGSGKGLPCRSVIERRQWLHRGANVIQFQVKNGFLPRFGSNAAHHI
ncbi:hypothetical protein DAPPUDRAFT_317436 [Daphnia pulex]|uniref:CCHC-type domain-containing protein n=1 Tax=Daphnia pulex TaxID=6669 RepID=E9GFZ7_DAPPU|nr:hypothetical protein DAPPUDRAFT_317436 [Daphnia pulex]|eukprot:EFX81312.1 hypothetical protein DAPPUDRAFT_317436 [Daphnia pulex]